MATPVSSTQHLGLLLELKTAAICLIDRGNPPQEVISSLYDFLKAEGIPHPKPGSQAAIGLWNQALNRANPARCDRILNVQPTYQL